MGSLRPPSLLALLHLHAVNFLDSKSTCYNHLLPLLILLALLTMVMMTRDMQMTTQMIARMIARMIAGMITLMIMRRPAKARGAALQSFRDGWAATELVSV
jgi:hypothetical protein